MNKIRYIFSVAILMMPTVLFAQKITLGSCITKDGGEFQGELFLTLRAAGGNP